MIVVESHVEWDEVENFYVACVKLTSTLDAQKLLLVGHNVIEIEMRVL